MLKVDHSQSSHSQLKPKSRGFWACTPTPQKAFKSQHRSSHPRRGLNVFEVYFCLLRENRQRWESLPNSSLLPTKLATRLTHLNLR